MKRLRQYTLRTPLGQVVGMESTQRNAISKARERTRDGKPTEVWNNRQREKIWPRSRAI